MGHLSMPNARSYDIHARCVHLAETDCPLARTLTKKLNRRYAAQSTSSANCNATQRSFVCGNGCAIPVRLLRRTRPLCAKGGQRASERRHGRTLRCSICLVDCVSHGACQAAKSLCLRFNKTFLAIPASSRSGFERALERLSAAPRQPVYPSA
jgi:hypothetical protein